MRQAVEIPIYHTPDNVALTSDPYNLSGEYKCYATANALDRVEAEYDFSKESGILVKKSTHGFSVYGLTTQDEAVAFLKKYSFVPSFVIDCYGEYVTHTTDSKGHRHTHHHPQLHYRFDITNFLNPNPNLEGSEGWESYFESDRILKKVQVFKLPATADYGKEVDFNLERLYNFIYSHIQWPSRCTTKHVRLVAVNNKLSIKPNNFAFDCCSCLSKFSWCLCCLCIPCCFYCYRDKVESEMPKPRLYYDFTVTEALVASSIVNNFPKELLHSPIVYFNVEQQVIYQPVYSPWQPTQQMQVQLDPNAPQYQQQDPNAPYPNIQQPGYNVGGPQAYQPTPQYVQGQPVNPQQPNQVYQPQTI